jgi:hypothetical protein
MDNDTSVRVADGSGQLAALDNEPTVATRVGSVELVCTRDRVSIHAAGRMVELTLLEARAVAAALLQITR